MIKERLNNHPIMAAAEYQNIEEAIASKAEIIVLMNGKLSQLMEGHLKDWDRIKPIFIHMDLLRGLGADQETMSFIKDYVQVSGIVSTKSNNIRSAKKIGLMTIQRIFLIDTRSLHNAISSVKENSPDAIEIMPGIAASIIPAVRKEIDIPIILSGLISTKELMEEALIKGADGISMSCSELWNWEH